mgnify:CR=1 FL=1|jgi:hypothetical protein
MADFLITLIVAFLLFGFLRRFIYFQALRSFTKAANDFRRQQDADRKPEGTITIDPSARKKSIKEDSDYVDYEEVK